MALRQNLIYILGRIHGPCIPLCVQHILTFICGVQQSPSDNILTAYDSGRGTWMLHRDTVDNMYIANMPGLYKDILLGRACNCACTKLANYLCKCMNMVYTEDEPTSMSLYQPDFPALPPMRITRPTFTIPMSLRPQSFSPMRIEPTYFTYSVTRLHQHEPADQSTYTEDRSTSLSLHQPETPTSPPRICESTDLVTYTGEDRSTPMSLHQPDFPAFPPMRIGRIPINIPGWGWI